MAGVNFFGPRKNMFYDLEGTLGRMKEIGVGSAEICVSFNTDPLDALMKSPLPEEMKKDLPGGIWSWKDADAKVRLTKDKGLSIQSVHMMLMGPEKNPEFLVGLIPKLGEFARKHDVKYFVLSLMEGVSGMKPYVESLEKTAAGLKAYGAKFLYHNHDAEMYMENGTNAMLFLMENCPDLGFELDMGWTQFAKVDSIEFLKAHRDRIDLIHLKDLTADACQENRFTCFTPVGEGAIPLKEILKVGTELGFGPEDFIIDQDTTTGDMLDDIAIGIKNINKCLAQL